MAEKSPPAATASAPKRRAPAKRKHTVGRVILATVLSLGLVTGLGVVFAYRHFDSNIDKVSIDNQIDKRLKRKGPKGQLNVLVMGDDTRAGENAIDTVKADSGRSDTTILLHLSEDRSRAYGVSIPRDSIVTRPDCGADNEIPGGTDQMWNAAYAVGGPACTVEQVEALTGIPIDHYVVIDFNGFKKMVDAIDGVPVCIPKDIIDREHGIELKAGEREIFGNEALSYVRVRSNVGDQSDLGRIKRQQAFIAAMVNKITSGGMLARPDRLLGFLDAVTESVQTDFPSAMRLARLGGQLQNIGLDNIKFVTVPWKYDRRPDFLYRVQWVQPDATELWKLIVDDKPLPRKFTDDSIRADRAPGSKKKRRTRNPDEAEREAAARAGLCA